MLSTLKFSSAGSSCFGGCCCYAIAGTAEGRAHKKTSTQQHNKRAASLGWGFAALANAPFGGGEPPPPEQPEQPNSPNSRTAEQPEQPNSPNSRTARTAEQPEQLPPLPSASPFPVRFRRLPRPAAVYHSAVLSAAALLFFRRRRPPPAPFICGRWLGSICATDGHGIISPAAKIGFFRLRSLTFPPSNPTSRTLLPFCCPRSRPAEPCCRFAALDPDQPNACGGGGFCRRCCCPRSRSAERLRQRWILLPLGGMASSRCRRQATAAKKRAVGKCVPAFARPTPLLAGDLPPPRNLLLFDGFQPLPPTGDSRKKKGGGEICACFRTSNSLAGWGSAPTSGTLTPWR